MHGRRAIQLLRWDEPKQSRVARLGATVLVTDFAPSMVERLRRNGREAGLADLAAEVMDGQALTLPDGSFDAAFSMFGLIFFPDRAAGFREIRRVLQPGGTAAVGVWSTRGTGIGPFLEPAARRVLPAPRTPAAPRRALSLGDPEGFAREMRAAGFARVEMQTVAHPWELPSAEAVWEALHTNPAIVSRFTEEQRAAVGMLVIDGLRAEFGAGPVRLEGEAHIGVGTK